MLKEDWLGLIVMPNGLPRTRFGCAVRRQVAPGGAVRNRLKRWLREAFRCNQRGFAMGLDVVAVVLRSPDKPSFRATQETLLRLSKRLPISRSGFFSGGSGSTGPS